ncbi:hypothetical protein CJ178_29020 [Rhodococcus sp. ACPA4]|nr:hypothetical protein CJ178_29020 [Rhodococcus sp. ACPA4]
MQRTKQITPNSLEGDPMRTYAERRPIEFEKHTISGHFIDPQPRCRDASTMTLPDLANMMHTPYP